MLDPISCLVILTIVLVGSLYIYENFYKLDVEVHFVAINDPNCNCYTNNRQAQRCNNEKCPAKLMLKIISKIEKAKKSIDIAMYNFTNSDLEKAILRARRRGVSIRIVVDKSAYESEDNHSRVVESLKNGKISSFFFFFPLELNSIDFVYILQSVSTYESMGSQMRMKKN